jgi:hypothetical protein
VAERHAPPRSMDDRRVDVPFWRHPPKCTTPVRSAGASAIAGSGTLYHYPIASDRVADV